ncbi:MAG: hypothetical protein CM15mP59_2750 [Flavobacteriaceae bacterium]|nr:MAG: hypothetical protein CM15mP59_2750 [Flavobacteriaceae bacterium]
MANKVQRLVQVQERSFGSQTKSSTSLSSRLFSLLDRLNDDETPATANGRAL